MSICQELYPTDEACRDAIVRLTEQNKGLEGALEEERIEVTRLANIVERLTTQRNALREALEKIKRVVTGEEGPEISGVFDEDARYNYPERCDLIFETVKAILEATKEPV